MLKAVVFDLDGTLLDTIPDIAAGLNAALVHCGLPTHRVRDYEAFVGGGIRQAVLSAVPPGTGEETVQRILDHYKVGYLARCTGETAPYPGIEQLLRSLEKRGVAVGVLSNKTEGTARKIVAHYFADYGIRFVYGRCEGRPLKPHPAAGEPVLAALGLKPEEVAYVGDSGTDVTFAGAVGFVPVGVSWGYRSREELVACGGRVFDTAAELERWLLENIG